MVTQLRQSGLLRARQRGRHRRAAELRRAWQARRQHARWWQTCLPIFPVRSSSGFRPVTRWGPPMTLPFGVDLPRGRGSAAARRSSRNQPSNEPDDPSHRHLRDRDGHAGRDAQAERFNVRGSDQDVYPPMSDFLAAEGIPALAGYRAGTHQRGPRSRRRRQCHLARQSRARGSARSQDPVLLAARSDPRALPLGRAVDCRSPGTHGKTTTTAMTGWLLTHGGARSQRPGRRHRAELRRARIELSPRPGTRLRHRRGRVRQRVLRQDREVPEVSAGHRRRQQRRVRPRGYLRGFRRRHAGVPPAGQSRAAARTAADRRRQPRRARAGATRRYRACETFGTGREPTLDWQAHDLEPTVRHDAVQGPPRRRRRSAASRCRWSARTTCATRLAAIAVATETGVSVERIAEGLRAFAGVKRRLEVVGVADGVTVYDDFAHHPTAVAETLAALRAAEPEARIWAVFEPRSASSCRRVFQDDFARAFAGADEVLLAPVFRSTLPESERLSIPQLVRDLECTRPVGARSRVDRRHRVDDRRRASARRSRRADVERRLRRHPSEAAAGARRRERRSTIVPAGDSALIVEFEARIDPSVNARAIALAEAHSGRASAGRPRRRADIPVGRDLFRSAAHERRRAVWHESRREAAQPLVPTGDTAAPLSHSGLLWRRARSGSRCRRRVRAR